MSGDHRNVCVLLLAAAAATAAAEDVVAAVLALDALLLVNLGVEFDEPDM